VRRAPPAEVHPCPTLQQPNSATVKKTHFLPIPTRLDYLWHFPGLVGALTRFPPTSFLHLKQLNHKNANASSPHPDAIKVKTRQKQTGRARRRRGHGQGQCARLETNGARRQHTSNNSLGWRGKASGALVPKTGEHGMFRTMTVAPACALPALAKEANFPNPRSCDHRPHMNRLLCS
jgi:hypothetical protein